MLGEIHMIEEILAIIFICILVLVFIGLLIFLLIISIKLSSYKKKSMTYKQLMELNRKYTFFSVQKMHYLKYVCKSRQKFNNFCYTDYLRNELELNYAFYSRIISNCKNNQSLYTSYLKEVSNINFNGDLEKNKMSRFILKIIMKRYTKKQPNCEFKIQIHITYTSPAGKVNLSAKKNMDFMAINSSFNIINQQLEMEKRYEEAKINYATAKEKVKEEQERIKEEQRRYREQERERLTKQKQARANELFALKKSEIAQNNLKKQKELEKREVELKRKEDLLKKQMEEFEKATSGHKYSVNASINDINSNVNKLNNDSLDMEEKLQILKDMFDSGEISFDKYNEFLNEVL